MSNLPVSEHEYKDEPRCKICNATDENGRRIRDLIDAYVAKGNTYVQLQTYLKDKFNIKVSSNSISNHFKKHSPFVRYARKTIGTKKSKKLHATIKQEMSEASAAIQRIINVGDAMVTNWVENKEGPKMPISERLYIEAIKEEGRRGIKTTLDVELEEMEEALFNEEIGS